MFTLIQTMLALAMPVQPAPPAALPGWMQGCWAEDRAGTWTEECWSAPRGGIMLGTNRSGRGERLAMWETMQIVRDQQTPNGVVPLAFWASPRGSNRTMFVWQPGTDTGATFVNATTDYPQRVRYWREGEMLVAETSLADGSKPMLAVPANAVAFSRPVRPARSARVR